MQLILQQKNIIALLILLVCSLLVFQACKSEEEEEVAEEPEIEMTEPQPEPEPVPMPEPEPEPQPEPEPEPEEPRERLDTRLFDDSGPFTVQIAAHRNRQMAEHSVNEWRESGFENAFIELDGNEETGDVWYKVNIGRYGSYSDALIMSEDMEQVYEIDTWARRISYP